jgi:hypothetical protein
VFGKTRQIQKFVSPSMLPQNAVGEQLSKSIGVAHSEGLVAGRVRNPFASLTSTTMSNATKVYGVQRRSGPIRRSALAVKF